MIGGYELSRTSGQWLIGGPPGSNQWRVVQYRHGRAKRQVNETEWLVCRTRDRLVVRHPQSTPIVAVREYNIDKLLW
jgi:hypothetical protein